MKNLCACGCKARITPKNNSGKRGRRKFAPGHNFENKPEAQRVNQIHRRRQRPDTKKYEAATQRRKQ